jgi:NTP pyrophosphatase (non-canonical NTP hydrolase)
MALKEIQGDADRWIQQYRLGYFRPHEIMVRLMEETGELAREINHEFGPKKKKTGEKENEIGDEMADIFFTLACLANSLDIDLDSKWKKMMDKLYTRDADRFEKK